MLRVAKRRYSFYFDAKHDFHEKHRKGKRRIKRGEYIYIYIYRNSESSGVETAEVEQGKKKLKKKHVGNTPSAKKTVGSMKHRLSSQRKYLL